MIPSNSYSAQHTKKQSLQRNSLAALGQVAPDMLMTDRATYVTYLETQLERVTSALLATQNHNNGQTAAEIQLKGIAEQLGSLEEKVAKVTSANRDTRRYLEEKEDLSKHAIRSLAGRLKAVEECQATASAGNKGSLSFSPELYRGIVAQELAELCDGHGEAIQELKIGQQRLQDDIHSLESEVRRLAAHSTQTDQRMEDVKQAAADACRAVSAQASALELLQADDAAHRHKVHERLASLEGCALLHAREKEPNTWILPSEDDLGTSKQSSGNRSAEVPSVRKSRSQGPSRSRSDESSFSFDSTAAVSERAAALKASAPRATRSKSMPGRLYNSESKENRCPAKSRPSADSKAAGRLQHPSRIRLPLSEEVMPGGVRQKVSGTAFSGSLKVGSARQGTSGVLVHRTTQSAPVAGGVERISAKAGGEGSEGCAELCTENATQTTPPAAGYTTAPLVTKNEHQLHMLGEMMKEMLSQVRSGQNPVGDKHRSSHTPASSAGASGSVDPDLSGLLHRHPSHGSSAVNHANGLFGPRQRTADRRETIPPQQNTSAPQQLLYPAPASAHLSPSSLSLGQVSQRTDAGSEKSTMWDSEHVTNRPSERRQRLEALYAELGEIDSGSRCS